MHGHSPGLFHLQRVVMPAALVGKDMADVLLAGGYGFAGATGEQGSQYQQADQFAGGGPARCGGKAGHGRFLVLSDDTHGG